LLEIKDCRLGNCPSDIRKNRFTTAEKHMHSGKHIFAFSPKSKNPQKINSTFLLNTCIFLTIFIEQIQRKALILLKKSTKTSKKAKTCILERI
jgi:hypothetical protein